jgi:hypothetical protein
MAVDSVFVCMSLLLGHNALFFRGFFSNWDF